MSPKALVPLAAVVAIAAIAVAAIALSRGGGDDGSAVAPHGATTTVPGTVVTVETPTPTATLGIAPDATPTPVRSPEQQARNLELIEAPAGMLQYTTDGPYVVPGDALGVFYLNIETQQIDGWYDLIGGQSPTVPAAFSGDNRFTLFERRAQTMAGGTTYPAGQYLGDRETQKLYRWEGEAEVVLEAIDGPDSEIASRDGFVLFRVSEEEGDDWFAVVDVEAGQVRQAFPGEAGIAAFSPDGARMAFANWTDTGTAWAVEVWAMNPASGEELFRSAVDFDGLDLEGTIELVNTDEGDGFVFVSNAAKPRFGSVAARFNWDGEALTHIKGSKVYISPPGDLAASMEPLATSTVGELPPLWSVITAFSTSDGTPLFKVPGAGNAIGRDDANRWLSDGSGFVVPSPGLGEVLVMRDGSLRDLPGVPSPTSPEVFAVTTGGEAGGIGAVVGGGSVLVSINFQGGVREFVDPWGDVGDEIRILLPHLGHGGPGISVALIEPYVEQPPFEGGGEVALQLNPEAIAFGLVNLYAEPGGDVIGQVEVPHRVVVHEMVRRCSGDFATYGPVGDCPELDTNLHRDFLALISGGAVEGWPLLAGYWARVTTPAGQEGWMLLQVQGVGI